MKEKILEIIYKYYPKNIDSNIETYLDSMEHRTLKSSIKVAEENFSKWNMFLNNLKEITYNKYEIEDWTQLFNNDACYTCRLSYSSIDNEFVDISINLSIISNYYSIYVSKIRKTNDSFSIPEIDFNLQSIEQELILSIKKMLIFSFSNYVEFPIELVNEIVDGVSIGNKNIGEATFFDCIFTPHVW